MRDIGKILGVPNHQYEFQNIFKKDNTLLQEKHSHGYIFSSGEADRLENK